MQVNEYVLKIYTLHSSIRLWIATDEILEPNSDWKYSDIHDFIINNKDLSNNELIDKLLKLYPAINAIEILDSYGNGPVIYRDWP